LVAIPALGVQSQSEVGSVVSESPGLVCPSFAEVLGGGEPPQGLEEFSEVVGVEEGFEVFSGAARGSRSDSAERWLP
jgi:hypothetical protein